MTFFQHFPVPPIPPRGRAVRYVPPVWAGAPLYELPAVVRIGQFLHRSPTMVMAVKSADVFSTGCSFDLSWTIRRGEETDEEWADLNEVFFRPGPGARRGAGGASMLLFGAAFPDGSKSSTGAHPHGFFEGTEEPDPAAASHPTVYADVVGRFLEGRHLPPVRREILAAPTHRTPAHRQNDRETGPPSTLDARLAGFRASHPYRTLDVDGVRWRYLAGGSGEQTVLLPSGGTRLPDMYLLLIEGMEQNFRVLAPAFPAGAGITGLADGLAAILDAEGVRRADVLGSSFGGFVAQTFARRHPERVRRLVLANTGSPSAAPLPLLPLLIRFLAVLPESAVRSLTGWNWRRWFVPGSQDDAMFWNKLLTDILSRLGKKDLLSALREMNDFAHLPATEAPGAPALAALPAPVLLIESERDEAFPPQARAALRALYPGAEVRLFAGAGHGVMATRTAEYLDTVREFLHRP